METIASAKRSARSQGGVTGAWMHKRQGEKAEMTRGRGRNKPSHAGGHGLPTAQKRALSREKRILAVIASDRTFGPALWRGEDVWLGRCLMCNAGVMASRRGVLLEGATLEHILPRHHGGDDDVSNLAIACLRCNQGKGRRIDALSFQDPRRREVTMALLERRRARWRRVEPGPAGQDDESAR